jgi:hypothetical protein
MKRMGYATLEYRPTSNLLLQEAYSGIWVKEALHTVPDPLESTASVHNKHLVECLHL